MNNVFNLDPDSIRKRSVKALKQIFGSRIKQNFLVQILDEVEKRIAFDITKYFSIGFNDQSMVSGSTDAVAFEICKNIVGIHRSNLIFLNDEERVALEADPKYREQLINDVISQIKLRAYAGRHFRKFPITDGDEFIYYPLPYYEFVACCYSENLLRSFKGECFGLYVAIFNKCLSALSLLEDGFLDNAYPLCRGAIELFSKLVYFHDDRTTLLEHNKFLHFEIDKECCGNSMKDEFKNLFKNRKNKNRCSLNNYLHYGWVDKITNYHEIIKNNPYTFNGFIDCLIKTAKIDSLIPLKDYYAKCSAFTHGNVVMSKYPLLHYFETSLMLGMIIRHTFSLLTKDMFIDTIIEGVDILKVIDKEFKKTESLYSKRSTENFENYYKSMFNF